MNVLTITQIGKGYVVEFREQKLLVLNDKALQWHLKRVAKFDKTAIKCITSVLATEPSVSIDLDHTVRKVS